MKFQPETLLAFSKDAKVIPTLNPVVVKLAAPAALFWHKGKQKVLIGYGTDFRVTLPDLDCEISAGAEGTLQVRKEGVIAPTGDVFTNFDKRPMHSAEHAAVTLALRRLARKERQLDEKRAEMDRAFIARHDVKVAEDKAPPEPKRVAKEEPVGEADPTPAE